MNVEFADVTALVDHIIYNTALKDVVCYIDGSRSLRELPYHATVQCCLDRP
jgi:hypothetical protein